MRPSSIRSPYTFALSQKVKHRVYKIHAFIKEAINFAETLQVISFKNDVYFLHGRSKSKDTLISKTSHFFYDIKYIKETLPIYGFVCLMMLLATVMWEV